MSQSFVKFLTAQLKQFDAQTDITDYKELIGKARQSLRDDYLAHKPATLIVKNYTLYIDRIIHHLWLTLGPEKDSISLLAVGGYGRAELHPYSDIDLLITSSRKIDTKSNEKISQFIRTLWDIGLDVGHSVRTISESVQLAKQDITTLTTLMEARELVDPKNLTTQLLERIDASHFCSAKTYTAAKIAEQSQRHQDYDDTEFNLEPNIKNGPGGLRDIQIIIWIAGRNYYHLNLKVLSEKNILNENEAQALIRCRNFLWRLRIGLHLNAKRKEDRLLFDHQRALAKDLGFEDSKNSLAVEKLMKRYYRTAKEIRLINQTLTQFFQQFDTNNKTKKQINQRFDNIQGYIEAKNDQVFIDYPPAFLEVFHLLQTIPKLKGIGANTIRSITKSLPLAGKKIRQFDASKEIFLNILKHPSGQTHTLRNMDTKGVLAAFIPSYHRIVGQMQHDLFHVYTVDAHSMFVLRNLRRFCLSKHKDEEPDAFNVMSQITKRERLYLAALFHDIAKGRGGDHSILGEQDALKFGQYLGLSSLDKKFVAWLVRHHLSMSWTAQREDISDPIVIQKFAELVGDQQHLNCLYLLTIADIKATGPKVWSKWKGKLLWDLYLATTRSLSEQMPAGKDINHRINEAKLAVKERLLPDFQAKTIDLFWQSLESQYFLHFSTEAIYWQQQTILSSAAFEVPFAAMRYNIDLEANQLLVYAPEHDALLPNVAGAIDHLNLSIINAQIERMKNGMSLLAFIITGLNGSGITESAQIKQTEAYICQLLRSGEKHPKPKKRRVSRRSKHFPIQTSVNFNQSDTGSFTIMQIITQDRPGLLYHVTNAMLEHKVHLNTARINTLGERVEDHFFITDRDGSPISDKNELAELKQSILSILDNL